MSTTKNGAHREPMSESETLRVDLEQTRQHLADTVQELSRRLNVPHRMKETAGHAGQTMKQTAGHAGQAVKQMPDAMKQVPGAMKQVPGAVKELPAMGKRHPKATAAVGGAVALGVGAAAWMARRHK
ncbi:MAG: DUF3618 domain-containing protein [Kribbellaceae bacterium]|nr:DUF3618 domain-containing protein [Kribbellaceae bacterium]